MYHLLHCAVVPDTVDAGGVGYFEVVVVAVVGPVVVDCLLEEFWVLVEAALDVLLVVTALELSRDVMLVDVAAAGVGVICVTVVPLTGATLIDSALRLGARDEVRGLTNNRSQRKDWCNQHSTVDSCSQIG